MSETQTEPVIILLSGDLMFGSKVTAAAKMAGWRVVLGGNIPPEDSPKLTDDSAVRVVVVDLSTRSKIVGSIRGDVQNRFPTAKLVAFGPHVAADRLNAARNAGFDQVLTNNQFSSGLLGLLEQWGAN
ncbi:MAG: histidine kinase [Planctomycetota bacterium]